MRNATGLTQVSVKYSRMDWMKRFVGILTGVLLWVACVSGARADSLPDAAYVSGVVGHAQGYSLSCEARSAADWAAFWGVSIGETEFLQALPRADNPDDGFVGNPNDAWGYIPPHSYGVHADPVAVTLNEFGLETDARRGLGWDDLREQISAGRPVIVWIIGQMWGGTPLEYEAPDGSTATVAAFEHTMILIGYGPDTAHLVDAYTGQTQTYWLDSFLASWSVLGNMAVVYTGDVSNSANPSATGGGDTYTVQRGDYLVALADRFGTTWQELASLNSIAYPYTIYPGQELQLPAGEEIEEESQPPPEPTEPPPVAVEAEFQLHLPMVYHSDDSQVTLTLPETFTVPRLESLVSFGNSVGVDWRLLAVLNNIHYPYVIFPGQVLRLR
jgi:uncharacterized protein YvpB